MDALIPKGYEVGITTEKKVQYATHEIIVVVKYAGNDDNSNYSIYNTAPGDPIQAITGAV